MVPSPRSCHPDHRGAVGESGHLCPRFHTRLGRLRRQYIPVQAHPYVVDVSSSNNGSRQRTGPVEPCSRLCLSWYEIPAKRVPVPEGRQGVASERRRHRQEPLEVLEEDRRLVVRDEFLHVRKKFETSFLIELRL